jgi:uncharacterized protein YkwD
MRLYNMGGISGYPDGTVKPNGTVTRAEFLALASKTIYPEKVRKAKSGEHWAKPFFDVALANETISPKFLDETTWNDNITRYEMAEIIVRFLEKVIEEDSETVLGVEGIMEDYEEVSTNSSSYYVQQAFIKGIITGRNENGLFAGNDNGTRAEAATLIIRLIDTQSRKEVVLKSESEVVEGNDTTNDEYVSGNWEEEKDEDIWGPDGPWGDWDETSENSQDGFDLGNDFEITKTFLEEYRKESLIEINRVRAENGVGPLKHSDLATEIAQYKSQDMYNLWEQGEPFEVYWSHDSANYGKWYNIFEIFNTEMGAENLGHRPYSKDIDKVSAKKRAITDVKGFESSPGHFAQMIDPQYTKVGFGIIKYQEEDELAYFLITQTFLK